MFTLSESHAAKLALFLAECVAARDPATEPLTVVFREGGGVLKATCSTGQEREWATE